MGEIILKIKKTSPLSGDENEMEIDVTQEQLDRWMAGELIQDVMPHLTKEEREFIMTGYIPEDWEVIFADH